MRLRPPGEPWGAARTLGEVAVPGWYFPFERFPTADRDAQLTYRRPLAWPTQWACADPAAGYRALVELDSADSLARVRLAGEAVGEHAGYLGRFAFEIGWGAAGELEVELTDGVRDVAARGGVEAFPHRTVQGVDTGGWGRPGGSLSMRACRPGCRVGRRRGRRPDRRFRPRAMRRPAGHVVPGMRGRRLPTVQRLFRRHRVPDGWVCVPGGEFVMGSPGPECPTDTCLDPRCDAVDGCPPPEPGRADEEAQHRVRITRRFLLKAAERVGRLRCVGQRLGADVRPLRHVRRRW